MKNVSSTDHTQQKTLPRGWVILGLALGSWAVVLGVGASASTVFQYILSAT